MFQAGDRDKIRYHTDPHNNLWIKKKQAFRLLPRSSHHDDRFDVTLRTWAIINALNKAGLKPQAQSKRICNADERG